MPEFYHANPTQRFSGLAEMYAQHRPSYPDAALDFVQTHCGLRAGAVLVDVGCGTGIAARLFAARGCCVIGIEPNTDMRQQAEATAVPAGVTPPSYRAGHAEATGLPDGRAAAVLAAQAFHWFEPQATLREFHRILQPAGWVILMWNERDATDPLTAAYAELIRGTSAEPRLERGDSTTAAPLWSHPGFQHVESRSFTHWQQLDEAGLLGRALSVSYAPRGPEPIERLTAGLRSAFAQYQADGKVTLHYRTVVIVGQRAATTL
ncbi:MAG: class I SAM-dependent methyltransferase [Gemmataceae bacterium]